MCVLGIDSSGTFPGRGCGLGGPFLREPFGGGFEHATVALWWTRVRIKTDLDQKAEHNEHRPAPGLKTA